MENCESVLTGLVVFDGDELACAYRSSINKRNISVKSATIKEKRLVADTPDYLWHLWPTERMNGYTIYSELRRIAYEICGEQIRIKFITGLDSNSNNGYDRIYSGVKIRYSADVRSLQLFLYTSLKFYYDSNSKN